MGLGLAIVKHLVELHGGVVEARSEGPTLGSVFVVKIPIAPVQPRSAPPSARGRPSPGSLAHLTCPLEIEGLKILVVDDEGDARDLVRAVLEQCKAKVATAANATEALAVLSTFAPDVIVSDIGMPEGDGYELIRKIRALPRDQGGRTPAVALTAYARPDDRIRALGAGFQSHASKPVDPQELLLVVANLAGRCGLRGP